MQCYKFFKKKKKIKIPKIDQFKLMSLVYDVYSFSISTNEWYIYILLFNADCRSSAER